MNKSLGYVFRVDASLVIGAGHVMRCLAIAERLAVLKSNIIFICRVSSGDLIELIQSYGYPVVMLEMLPNKVGELKQYNNLEKDCIDDIGIIASTILDFKECICIVDHYDIDKMWESLFRKYCKFLIVVDDLADRRHDCDFLVDFELGEKTELYRRLVPAESTLLLGAKYSLLRAQFSDSKQLAQAKILALKKVGVVLVSLGAYDQNNITPVVVEVIKKVKPELEIRIIVSSQTPNIAEIKSLNKKFSSVVVLTDVHNMASEILKCDIAVGNVGGGAYERASLGVTGCVIPLADNQRAIATEFEQYGLAKVVLLNERFAENLTRILTSLITSPLRIKKMAAKSIEMIDSNGVDNFIEAIARARIEKK